MTTAWLASVRARADRPPAQPREALFVAGHAAAIGSIEAALARQMAAAGLPLVPAPPGWCVSGAARDAAFERIAHWLRAQGRASAWRDERLRVSDAAGTTVAMIERAAVRPLGIATHAVHLVGWAEAGGMWVQQRAFDKSTDPGRWDTLMGGLVSADEDISTTLARETWEEAGLDVAALRALTGAAALTVRRPLAEGYMVEHIHVFEACVPPDLTPLNQDGEVAAFERLGGAALRERLHANAFTLEASLILGEALQRRGAPA